jgi:starch synthase
VPAGRPRHETAGEPSGVSRLAVADSSAVRIVRATGGLADTVRPGETGFVFRNYNADELWAALREALHVYRTDMERWRALQRNAMSADHSWGRSARDYEQVYQWAVSRARGW